MNFNGMSTRLGLFYARRFGYCIHCTFISKFSCSLLKKCMQFYIIFYPNNFKQIYLTYRLYPNRCYRGKTEMKRYSTLFRGPELESHHQMQFRVIPRIWWPFEFIIEPFHFPNKTVQNKKNIFLFSGAANMTALKLISFYLFQSQLILLSLQVKLT